MRIGDKPFRIDENEHLTHIEDHNESNKAPTTIPSNNSENNNDKLFVYQGSANDKLFKYQDPAKDKLFVYQGDKENDNNICQNSNQNIDELSATSFEQQVQQPINTPPMHQQDTQTASPIYPQQSPPQLNGQQTNSFNYLEPYNFPSDIPQQFETQVQQPINTTLTYQQNTQTSPTTMYTQQNSPHLNGQQFYPSHPNAVEHEKHKHQFEPITLDDYTFCTTYVAKLKIDSNQRLALKNYTELAQELMRTHKKDTIDIARLYIVKAIDYDTKIKLELYYINANEFRSNQMYISDWLHRTFSAFCQYLFAKIYILFIKIVTGFLCSCDYFAFS